MKSSRQMLRVLRSSANVPTHNIVILNQPEKAELDEVPASHKWKVFGGVMGAWMLIAGGSEHLFKRGAL